MNLLETFNHKGNAVDIFHQDRKEVYATIEQLANLIGYQSKGGIERMLERNSYLKEKAYSVIASVHHSVWGADRREKGQRKAYETRLFTRLGIVEVLSLTSKNTAKELRAVMVAYIEKLERELSLAKIAHAISIGTQNALHDAIAGSPVYREYKGQLLRNVFTNFNKLLNQCASKGRTDKKAELMDYEIELLKRLERKTAVWLDEGLNYQAIKKLLEVYCESECPNTLGQKESPLLNDREQVKGYVFEYKEGRLYHGEY